MARLNRLSRISDKSSQQPTATEPKLVAFKISTPAPHRQYSLLAITIILNILLWSSVICSIIALFQIASDSKDGSNTLPGVLTLVSVGTTTRPSEDLSLITPGHRNDSIRDRTYSIFHQTKGPYPSAIRPWHHQKDDLRRQPSGGLVMRLMVADCWMEHDTNS